MALTLKGLLGSELELLRKFDMLGAFEVSSLEGLAKLNDDRTDIEKSNPSIILPLPRTTPLNGMQHQARRKVRDFSTSPRYT